MLRKARKGLLKLKIIGRRGRSGGDRMAYSLLGKNFTPPDVEAKVTGRAKYAEDFRVEGMVFCRLFLSPIPHGLVRNIAASEALAMECVLGRCIA